MNEPANQASINLARPDNLLDGDDGIAVLAWQAYNAMETTKRRHFEWLEILDEKKKNFNIDPTDSDRQRLACLLHDHDEQVKRFTRASEQLKSVDTAAHAALFVYIGAVSAAERSGPVTH